MCKVDGFKPRTFSLTSTPPLCRPHSAQSHSKYITGIIALCIARLHHNTTRISHAYSSVYVIREVCLSSVAMSHKLGTTSPVCVWTVMRFLIYKQHTWIHYVFSHCATRSFENCCKCYEKCFGRHVKQHHSIKCWLSLTPCSSLQSWGPQQLPDSVAAPTLL